MAVRMNGNLEVLQNSTHVTSDFDAPFRATTLLDRQRHIQEHRQGIFDTGIFTKPPLIDSCLKIACAHQCVVEVFAPIGTPLDICSRILARFLYLNPTRPPNTIKFPSSSTFVFPKLTLMSPTLTPNTSRRRRLSRPK